jgi:hypothetical protein
MKTNTHFIYHTSLNWSQWRTEGGFKPRPPENSEVLTKLNRIPSSLENKSVTT